MGTGSQSLTRIRRVLTPQLGTGGSVEPLLRFFNLTDDSVTVMWGWAGQALLGWVSVCERVSTVAV